MKSTFLATALVAFGVDRVVSHATFQDFWINGVDMISTPSRKTHTTTSPYL